MKLLASHRDAQEADYSRMQAQNIVNAIVRKQEVLDAQIDLVLANLKYDRPLDIERTATAPVVAEIPG